MSNKERLETIISNVCNDKLEGLYLPLALEMAQSLQVREEQELEDTDLEMISSGVVYAASVHLSLTEGLVVDDEAIANAFSVTIPQMEDMANHLFQLESLLGASEEELDLMEQEETPVVTEEVAVEDDLKEDSSLTINRFAVTLTPKQLFVDFLNRMEVSETPLHIEHFRNQSSVYLIDDSEDVHLGAPENFLASHAEKMVQMELTKEFVDAKYWPTNMDIDHLLSWFDYSISIMVTDLHAPHPLLHDVEA
ncbi:hypothetical protein K5X82_08315 [Halosquirtibacter xylanolyticus]|uniref:hypothetical protein n=1 Tax=Halosquirtibacter xylanolyticus TaxID=3374599 RepID=UPI0037482C6A|nr:hypothetical protein K5X82_08315 [Prolixibacteraceae bacterium]